MQRALDFDKTPALCVPLPFLINVPVFMLMAAVLSIATTGNAFNSRWNSTALAITHIWTLGILASAMMGALMQILAVACNVAIKYPRLTAISTYISLSAGTLALIIGFLWWYTSAWALAAILLGISFTIFLGATAAAIWYCRKQVYKGAKEILVPVRLALIALAVASVLGIIQVTALYGNLATPELLSSHILWGLLGWGGLLLMAMSFQLLPIFQLTELYPKLITKWLAFIIFAILLAWTAIRASSGLPALMLETAEFLLVLSYLAWLCASLQRLWTRKRPKPEPTSLFWFTAVASMLACAPVWVWLNHSQTPQAASVLGVLIIMGGLGSAINGMLYKIVPFLLWKHAQDAMVIPDIDPRQARVYLKVMPKMAAYIPTKPGQIQWALHTISIMVWVLAAAKISLFMYMAGYILLLSAILLSYNIAKAILLYRQTLKLMAQLPHHQNSNN